MKLEPTTVSDRARTSAALGTPGGRAAAGAAVAVGVHVGLVAAYLEAGPTTVTSLAHAAYPVVWVGASVYAALWVALGPVRSRVGPAGALVGLAYLGLLAVVTGMVGTASTATGARVSWATPGWGPIVGYSGASLSVMLVPFQVVGYVTLSYLFGLAVARSGRSLGLGVLGAATCVGCWGSALAAGASLLLGGTVAASTVALGDAYGLSTAAFLLALAAHVYAVRRTSP